MLRAPLTVQVEVTDKCNYRCPHCYRLDNSILPIKVSVKSNHEAKVWEISQKLIDWGVFSIVLTGGEPLTHKRLTSELVRHISSANIHVSINTNLVLINEKYLNELISGGLDSLLVSCPSTDPSHYSVLTGGGRLEHFMTKLKLLNKTNVHYTVNMVVGQMNFADVNSTAKALRDAGVTRFAITPMSFNPDSPLISQHLCKEQVMDLTSTIYELSREYKLRTDVLEALPTCVFSREMIESSHPATRRQCQAGKTTAAVDPEGNVRSCTHNNVIYGNMLNEDLGEIWSGMSEWRDGSTIPTICHDCAAEDGCQGGCRVNARVATGSLSGLEPWCFGPINTARIKDKVEGTMINMESTLVRTRLFRYRKETDLSYLICTYTPINTTHVTNELFEFINSIDPKTTYTVYEIANLAKVKEGELSEFIKLITRLVQKGFFSFKS